MCAKQPGWRIYFPAPALQNISSGESFSWSSQRFTEACIEHNHARIHTFRKHNYTFVEAEHLKDNRYCRIAPKTVQGLKYNVAKLLSRYYSHSKKKHLIKCCLASRKSTSHKSVSSYQRFSQRCSISPASGTRDNKTCGFNGIPRISIATSWNFKKMRSLRVFQGFRDFDRKGGRTVDILRFDGGDTDYFNI